MLEFFFSFFLFFKFYYPYSYVYNGCIHLMLHIGKVEKIKTTENKANYWILCCAHAHSEPKEKPFSIHEIFENLPNMTWNKAKKSLNLYIYICWLYFVVWTSHAYWIYFCVVSCLATWIRTECCCWWCCCYLPQIWKC